MTATPIDQHDDNETPEYLRTEDRPDADRERPVTDVAPNDASDGVDDRESESPAKRGRDANAEAARHRVAAREAQATAAAQTEKIRALQQRDVITQLETAGAFGPTSVAFHRGEDLFSIGGVSIDDLLDANGDLDSDRVAAARAAVIQERPYLENRDGGKLLSYILRNTAAPDHASGGQSWQSAIRN